MTGRKDQTKEQKRSMETFLNICLSITSQTDREQLLSDILDKAMELNNCDAGTLYLLEDDGLHFCRMVTKSIGLRQGGHDDPIGFPPVPLQPQYVSSYSVMHNEPVHIDSVRDDERFDFSGSMRYDEMTGYFTGTMFVVPLANDKGELIGAVQLINALPDGVKTVRKEDLEKTVVGFRPEIELLTNAMASLAQR